MNDPASNATQLKSIFERLVDAYDARAKGDAEPEQNYPSDPISNLAWELKPLLQNLDAASIEVLVDALSDPDAAYSNEKRRLIWQVYRWSWSVDRLGSDAATMCLRNAPMPEELIEPILRSAAREDDISISSGLVRFVCIAHGFRRAAEFFIRNLPEERDMDKMERAVWSLYGLVPARSYLEPKRSEPGGFRIFSGSYERDGLTDIYDNLQQCLVGLFMKHEEKGLRRALASKLDPEHPCVPEELRATVREYERRP